ncbi:MAG: MOSC domain-containing protein [Desulfomonilaceae bacterium]
MAANQDEPHRSSPTKGTVVAVCVSKKKGTPKTEVASAVILEGYGLEGDAHGGPWHRQVSLLSVEQISAMKDRGLEVGPGSFAENLTTEGVDLDAVSLGDLIAVGDSALLEVAQIGKECHTRCAIYHRIGDCIMPSHGIFARVKRGGVVRKGDAVEVVRGRGTE